MDLRHQFSIVVAGNMNPAIHQPFWYLAGALVSEEDVKTAIASGAVVVSPQLSQFETSALRIQCAMDKWIATCPVSAPIDAALALAKETFGARLVETPVSGIGVNLNAAHPLPEARRGTIFERLQHGPFAPAVGSTQPELEQLGVAYALDPLEVTSGQWLDRRFRVKVTLLAESSPTIHVSINFHHQIRVTPPGKFDLGPMLDAAARTHELARAHAALLIKEATED